MGRKDDKAGRVKVAPELVQAVIDQFKSLPNEQLRYLYLVENNYTPAKREALKKLAADGYWPHRVRFVDGTVVALDQATWFAQAGGAGGADVVAADS